jgi:peptide/nickel transport system substrate-binding protein
MPEAGKVVVMLRKISWLGVFVLAFSLVLHGAAQEERTGAWVDEVVAVEEPSADAAVLQLEIGAFDVYAFSVTDPAIDERVQASPDLDAIRSFGSYGELRFNTSEFEDGRLNPFSVPRIREAMNRLIDRDYIAQEIFGGMARPKFFPITTVFPDYARMVDVARALEIQYAHNPELAVEVITEEMEALGAQMVGGSWQFGGAPVEIIALIRTEDERMEVGDYVASLLEDVGFTVTRDYRTAAEASPIWLGADPTTGQFHFYTGGWITTVVDRDQSGNFDFFYTPRGRPDPTWQAYTPSPEFDEVADRLNRSDFRSMEERHELMARALELSLQDSTVIWTVDQASITPHRGDITVAADLAGHIAGAWLWPYTLRRGEEVGGTVTVAMPSMLTAPWNPIGGTNWIFDMMLIRGTMERPSFHDPFTGLMWPQRLERAEVFIEEGLPVDVTHDWVTLEFVSENQVPEDAWADWDATEQRFITVGERFPEGVTANRRAVIYYPEDLFEISRWHDGSPLSLGDMVLRFILVFDRAKEESPIFDEAAVPAFESFLENFRGLRIVSEQPLVVELYSNTFYLDAEENAHWAAWQFWPEYTQGPGAWHNMALGIRAEANEELAFTSAKSDRLDIEYMSYIAGPSIPVLERLLSEAAGEGYIPYAPTLSQFVTPEEASQRYENLQAWYGDKGHFWLGTGAFFLERAFPLERTAQLLRFEDFPDPADKWEVFEEPRIAEVELDGPGLVTIGEQAEFEVWVEFAAEPYPADEITEVRYLVFDAAGDLVLVGDAEVDGDGLWRVVLSAEETAQLPEGSNRLEVAVVPLLVSIPAFDAMEFVTTN